jgi:hypothetical protein
MAARGTYVSKDKYIPDFDGETLKIVSIERHRLRWEDNIKKRVTE